MARNAPKQRKPGRPVTQAPRTSPIHLRIRPDTLAGLTAWAAAERRPLTQLLALIADDAVAAWEANTKAKAG